MRTQHAWAWVGVGVLVSAVALSADTLVMRDGRRVQGLLIGVREGTIEFEVQRGFFGRERARIPQNDVVSIEFDQESRPSSDLGGNGGGNATGPVRPSGMRERDVNVPANSAMLDTGVVVRGGQTVYFSANGRVRWGPGRQDGPGGERNSPRNEARPIPSRPAAGLIGRVGEEDEYFFIGDDQGPIRLRGSGRLYLGINDDFLQDNTGSFRVTVFF